LNNSQSLSKIHINQRAKETSPPLLLINPSNLGSSKDHKFLLSFGNLKSLYNI